MAHSPFIFRKIIIDSYRNHTLGSIGLLFQASHGRVQIQEMVPVGNPQLHTQAHHQYKYKVNISP